MKKRIWELDAFRGLCILGVVLVHFVYDLVDLYKIVDWQYPAWFAFIKNWGGILFIVLSGICVTLGSHSLRRGLVVFASGMVISAVTYGMYKLNLADKSIIIWFGVLHCLGLCMILWPAFRKAPWWILLLLGVIFVYLGFHIQDLPRPETKWLMPLGLYWDGFASSDYFPLLPNFGYFLVGSVLGNLAYRKKRSLMPDVSGGKGLVGLLQWCGRHSLWIYLLHQPILNGICWLILLLK
jgi:uncharacterized membrane protein